MAKRRIDAHRNGAFSMLVGAAEEGLIGETFATDDAWYITKPEAIYKIQLADHIDPERTNPTIPNTQQKVYSLGYTSKLVCRSVLTAKSLLTRERYGEARHKEAISLSLMALDCLIKMEEIAEDYIKAEDIALQQLKTQNKREDSLVIPSVHDIPGRIKGFIQSAEHFCQALYKIGGLVYPVENGWVDGLVASIKTNSTSLKDEDLVYFQGLTRFMKFIRNARHCVEHPKIGQMIICRDFALDIEGNVKMPSIAIDHSKTPEPEISISTFFRDINDSALEIADSFVASICAFDTVPFGAFPICIVKLPEERRRNILIRYSYVIAINNDWQPLQ